MTFAYTDETTTWVERTGILAQCDHDDEEHPGLADQTMLIRLHNELHAGRGLDDLQQETVRELTTKLHVTPQKVTNVSRNTRTGQRVNVGQFILSHPLGPYYTKLSLPFEVYHSKEVREAWDKNPIEQVEMSMIPRVSVDYFRTHRLNRAIHLTLHFESPHFSEVFTLLMGVELLSCITLELRNVRLPRNGIEVLKKRLQWPNLFNIINKG